MSVSRPRVDEKRYPACDVVVVGGGMAGIAAATAAARSGSGVLLVERAGWLGGMGITGATGLHSFFNVFDAAPGAARTRVVAGIAQEMVDRVREAGGGLGHVRLERGGDFVSMVTPVEPETFKLAAAEMCLKAGVKILFHTVVDEVRATNGHVDGVVLWNKSGRSLVRAKTFVDCTGDGDLAAWAGAPFEKFGPGDAGAYPAGFTFRLCNVDLGELEADVERRGMLWHVAHAVKPGMREKDLVRIGINMGELKNRGEDDAPGYFFASSLRPRELTYCNCINYGPNDGLDAEALSAAEVDLRRQMAGIVEMFRRNFSGCAESYAAGPSPSAGQRRGRAIRCEYELTQDDCTSGREFGDQIACFGFIDNGRYFVRDAGAYGIPYRALVPRETDNVLIAGRMMTVDLVAHNSTRNTVCCLACGQAAGTAAAMAAGSGVPPAKVDAGVLRERLKDDGVLLAPRPDPL